MTVMKQYNPATSTWQAVMVGAPGEQGPPGEDGMEIGPNPPADTDILWADTGSTGVGDYITTFPFVDSAEFGLVGDGVADDTVALQAFLDASPRREHHLRNGTYRTTATLTIPDQPGYLLSGESRASTFIKADFANAAILRCCGQDMNNYRLQHFGLQYTTPQPAANTNAVGLLFDAPAVTPFGYAHLYYSTLFDLSVDGACFGIAVKQVPGVYSAIWNVVFDTIHFSNTSTTLIYINSANGGGHPINTFRMITSINAPGTGPALHFIGVEFSIDGLDIEDWAGPIIIAYSGGGTIRGIHLERQRFTADVGRLFDFSDGAFSVEGYVIMMGATTTTNHCIFRFLGNGRLRIGGGSIDHTAFTGATSFALLRATGGQVEMTLPGAAGNGTYYTQGYYPWEATPQFLTTNSGFVTWDPASVAANTQTSTTVTVDGAVVGDVVAVGFSTVVPAGVQLTGSATAANTVTVTLVNHTAAPVDLASGTLRARIWKAF